jgi:ABC-type multidrug transport system permease subunit
VIEPEGSQSWKYRYDPTRPEASAARQVIDDVLQQAAGRTNPRQTTDVLVNEPGSRYIDFLIPGLIGLNAMGGGLWGIGFLLVNFRVAKLLKRFVATPMPRRDFLLALLGARLTFVIPDLAVLLLLGTLMFHMPIRGSLALVIAIDMLGALAFAGIGLLVACRARTTEAVSGLMNLVMLPMWLFSGVFFASDRFPAAAQPFIQALPLTQLVGALRRVLLEGAGIVDVSSSIAILAAWAVITFMLALRFFRWT